jgi:hypothetical protein
MVTHDQTRNSVGKCGQNVGTPDAPTGMGRSPSLVSVASAPLWQKLTSGRRRKIDKLTYPRTALGRGNGTRTRDPTLPGAGRWSNQARSAANAASHSRGHRQGLCSSTSNITGRCHATPPAECRREPTRPDCHCARPWLMGRSPAGRLPSANKRPRRHHLAVLPAVVQYQNGRA